MKNAVASTNRVRILCVDDHVVVLAGLSTIIENQPDMEVVACATTGAEAVKLYRLHKPDVTLMDLQLSGMDGFQTIRAIVSEDPTARIVVLTMFQGEEDIYRAYKAGAWAYLLKETLADNLVRIVREIHSATHRGAIRGSVGIPRLGTAPAVTSREAEVLQLMGKGRRNKEIAGALGITEDTVQAHMKSIFVKLDVHDRTAALAEAIRRGIIHVDPASRR